MGQEDVYELLEKTGRLCYRDIMSEMDITATHAYNLMRKLAKRDDIDVKYIIEDVPDGVDRKKLVKYLIITKKY